MPNQENESLLDLLKKVSELPEYMRNDAIKNIVDKWEHKSPLVSEVVKGNTTFKRAITALVEENKKLRCFKNTGTQFETIAKETETRFAGILSLVGYQLIPRLGVIANHLTESVNFGKMMWRTVKFNVYIFLPAVLTVWVGLSYFLAKEFFTYWMWVIGGGVAFGLLLSIGYVFIGYPRYFSNRRVFAETILQRAKFLDTMLAPNKA